MASKTKIRGITIEIGGDTSGLLKSLDGVNKSIKNTQSQLKDVNKLLKLDPGNTELLTQKQKLLGDAVKGTKEKLDTLKAANIEAAESVKKYDDWKAAHDPIQAEIDETKEKLGELKKQAKDAEEQLASGKISQDKYDAIKQSVNETEDKLKALREQAAAVDDEFGHPISPEQFDALQREIIETENDLKSLTDEMKNFGSVTEQKIATAGEKLKAFSDKMGAVGTAMTKTVTAPIVGVATASVAAFNEVDEGLDIITKKTGATGDALADMQERAKNLATSIPTDFRTAGTAVGEVNTRFGLMGEDLEDLSGRFIRFAQLNDTDLNSAIDNTQAAMAAFGISTDGAGAMLDLLNKAAQDTGADVGQLTTDLLSNSAALQEMGFGVEESVGFLANLNKNGLDSSAVMTGLKKALQNATQEGKPMRTALQELQSEIAGATGHTEAMQTATELFGSKAAPALAQAIRDGRISFEDFANGVKGYRDSVNETFEETQDPVDEFKTALNELKIVGMDLVVAAAPFIKEFADTLKSLISGLRDGWESLGPDAQETIIKLAAIAAILGPVLVLGGKLLGGIGTLMTLVPQISGVISGLWGVLAANPIAAVVTALVGAFAYFYATSEEFRTFIDNLVGGIVDGIVSAGSYIVEFCKGIVSTFVEASGIDGLGNQIEYVLRSAWEGIKQLFTDGFQAIDDLTGGRLSAFKDKVTEVWDNVVNFVKNGVDKLKSLVDFHWELPKIKLPHFSISGSFSLNPPSIPHIGVEWYKKAMQDGMILSSPTILPSAGGGLRGFGDAGPEAVVGVDSLRSMIREAVAGAGQGNRPINVVFELEGVQKWIYRLNRAEEQRVGVRLASEVD